MMMVSNIIAVLVVVLRVLRLLARLLVVLVELLFWIGATVIGLSTRVIDAGHARRTLVPGGILCPVGHVNETDNLFLECDACGHRFVGNIWQCPSPECGARTIEIRCTTCSASIRNPYRWGRA